MKLTGASEDSLTNVGLGFPDSIFEPIPNTCVSECPSNPVPSYVSRNSDQLWSTSASRPVPTIQTSTQHATWDRRPSRPAHPPPPSHRNNSLRVALPPEEGRSSPCAINTQNSNTYGSILELEASPRRYRNKELREFYYSSQDSPTYPPSRGDYGEGSSHDSSLNMPPPMEPPPALPERLPKLPSLSPPPLPPKRLLGPPTAASQDSLDIYDLIPEASPRAAEPELSMADLAKMNVVELSRHLTEGRLPARLSGMSLLQLVDHVGRAASSPSPAPQSQTSRYIAMQPSFSDNFVASNQQPESRYIYPEAEEDLRGAHLDTLAPQQRLSPLPPSPQAHFSHSPTHGFDDDFSQMSQPPVSEPPSNPSPAPTEPVVVAPSYEHDRYAVFRELQMEEELVNAWKSPTQESPEVNLMGEEDSATDLAGDEVNNEETVEDQVLGEEEEQFAEAVEEVEDEQFYVPAAESLPAARSSQEDSVGNLEWRGSFPTGDPLRAWEESENNETLEETHNNLEDSYAGPVQQQEGHCGFGNDSENRDERSPESASMASKDDEQNLFHPPSYDPPVLRNGSLPQTDKEAPGNENDAFEDNFFPTLSDNNNHEVEARVPGEKREDPEHQTSWATFEDSPKEASPFHNIREHQDKVGARRSTLFPERSEVYKKLDEEQEVADQGYSGSQAELGDSEARAKLHSPQALRDLSNPTANLQARYHNFKRFDQVQASPDESPRATFPAQRLPNADPFEAEWEPSLYTRRSKSTDPDQGEEEPSGWGVGAPRPGTEPPRQWSCTPNSWTRDPPPPPLPARSSLNIEEAFPPARPAKTSRQSSSRGSTDSVFNQNPFTDNFVPDATIRRGVSATPPVFEGEVPPDRISNTSDMSFQSGEAFLESQEMFDKQNSFSAGFKVQAKTIRLPQSDSVDIFSVAADPFDDDFFK